MNIEQIAVGIKDAHGLDMSDEAAITLLRHALSKLAEQAGGPVFCAPTEHEGRIVYEHTDKPIPNADSFKLYTETQCLAAQQLAASQLHNTQLREALVACIDFEQAGGFIFDIAKQALALPADTTALESMIAKAGEIMRERCVAYLNGDEGFAYFMGSKAPGSLFSEAIRSLPGVTLGDLQ